MHKLKTATEYIHDNECIINTPCYLCGSMDFKYRKGIVRDNPGLKILQCQSCGLVFLSSFKHIGSNFYENSQMHGLEPLDIESWIKETEQDDERRFQFLRPIFSNRSLLDLGCGTGNFLLKAKNFASDVCGIEPELRLQEHFRKMGLQIYHRISDITSNRKFDIITLFHVLEHLHDPKNTLLELSRLLTDNGQIIIEVPNADDALLTLYECEPFSRFTYWNCHLFLFNADTLKLLTSQTSLKVNYIKQVQRYSLANHLFWLSKGKPGGHKIWNFLDSVILQKAYEEKLAAIGKCDTIIISLSFKNMTKSL